MLHKYFFLRLLLWCRRLAAARGAGGARGPRQRVAGRMARGSRQGCMRCAWPAAVGGGVCDARGRGGVWRVAGGARGACGARRAPVRGARPALRQGADAAQRAGGAGERERKEEGGREKKLGVSWIQGL
ncbi:hypothetical protein PVAP13_4NG284838 [Panicum virgatum]|uniref:Uncharacterized protein n=1 Tax=Panicum virgatum TaxID=38727 RepID=A0A8T0TEZ6_PANVG|nr:hypothetical protein PVAP13_4NG284838 [Panicum virgatum]